MREAAAIRLRVFVAEQGVPLADEVDEHDRDDASAVHVLARSGAIAFATGRFYALDDASVRIGRMAVEATHRGAGAGRAILQALLLEAARRGFVRAELHAQVHARGFYLRSGFADDGATLWDAGILHQPMSVSLVPSRDGKHG